MNVVSFSIFITVFWSKTGLRYNITRIDYKRDEISNFINIYLIIQQMFIIELKA